MEEKVKMLFRLKILMVVGLFAVLLGACKNIGSQSSFLSGTQIVTIDQKIVDFDVLKEEGKVIVVNFWATSCTTCKKEMPKMIQMYQDFSPKGLDYLGVAMFYDDLEYIKNYVAAQKIPFNVTWDAEKKLDEKFGGILGTPTTFIIDKRGNIVKRYVGEVQWEEFYFALNQALSGS